MGGVPPQDVTAEQFDHLVAVNAKAPFFIANPIGSRHSTAGSGPELGSGISRPR
ncbi:hypothetical protein [Amycolatopsis sp. NPDC051903]|uniref:hypothetical protein n=1 Tax=Amycolatopsis sp. NPDC051903 TaxID=3363936 RepID=UPI0037A9389F